MRQGELGDCWLLAPMSVLAEFPGHIRNLFDEEDLAADGKYTVRLYDICKGWQEVVLDDRIPCDCRGVPLFTQLDKASGAVWPLLLEKALAKFVGCYARLVGGTSTWAWQVLTGQRYQAWWKRQAETASWRRFEQKNLDELEVGDGDWRTEGMKPQPWKGPVETLKDEEMFKIIATYLQANFPVTCSISEGGMEERRADGLRTRHEYSLLQVVSFSSTSRNHQIVQIRNPWGKGG